MGPTAGMRPTFGLRLREEMILGVRAQQDGRRVFVTRGEWRSSDPAILTANALDHTGVECVLLPLSTGVATVTFVGQATGADGGPLEIAGDATIAIFSTSTRGTLAVDLLVNTTPRRMATDG